LGAGHFFFGGFDPLGQGRREGAALQGGEARFQNAPTDFVAHPPGLDLGLGHGQAGQSAGGLHFKTREKRHAGAQGAFDVGDVAGAVQRPEDEIAAGPKSRWSRREAKA
jgi:hypothetical protein